MAQIIMQYTVDGFKQMLKRYRYNHVRLFELNRELSDIARLCKDGEIGIKNYIPDGMPHARGISDVTYKNVELLLNRYYERSKTLVKEINDLLDEKEVTDNALHWLFLNDPDSHRVVNLRYFGEKDGEEQDDLQLFIENKDEARGT